MEKETARRIVQEKIARLTENERQEKSKSVEGRLFSLDEFQRSKVIMFFVGVSDEVDTAKLLARALDEGKIVALPKTYMNRGDLAAFAIKGLSELQPGTFGILEPPEAWPIAVASIDFIVVPARAYDRKGNRLGRGKGFYDRFLAQTDLTAVRCGVAFDCQIFPHIAHTPSDEPVDIIITESEVIRCR
ncbi:MAG: hypothetical protein AMS15_05530 [Planctomycetes bacterium DG_23]|nr:MAG: hypothetical protein AMS15_05530 [Planctomycetes bacterium DG_23]